MFKQPARGVCCSLQCKGRRVEREQQYLKIIILLRKQVFCAIPIWDLIFPSVLRHPNLGFDISKCFCAVPIWDLIFPSVFTLSRFGI